MDSRSRRLRVGCAHTPTRIAPGGFSRGAATGNSQGRKPLERAPRSDSREAAKGRISRNRFPIAAPRLPIVPSPSQGLAPLAIALRPSGAGCNRRLGLKNPLAPLAFCWGINEVSGWAHPAYRYVRGSSSHEVRAKKNIKSNLRAAATEKEPCRPLCPTPSRCIKPDNCQRRPSCIAKSWRLTKTTPTFFICSACCVISRATQSASGRAD